MCLFRLLHDLSHYIKIFEYERISIVLFLQSIYLTKYLYKRKSKKLFLVEQVSELYSIYVYQYMKCLYMIYQPKYPRVILFDRNCLIF